MYKRFLPFLAGLISIALASCDASFNVPPTVPLDPNAIPLVDLKTNPYPMTGFVLPSFWRCGDSLPPGSRIIVAWEVLSLSKKGFYVYGTGTVEPVKSTITWASQPPQPLTKGYKLDVTIDSNLPRVVFWPSADSTDAIAVGHLFLTTNQFLRNRDTIPYENFETSDDILGGVELTAVVYRQGNPKLFGKQISQIDQGHSHQGFNFLRGYKTLPADPKKFGLVVDSSDSQKFYIDIEDNRDETEWYNPYWLK